MSEDEILSKRDLLRKGADRVTQAGAYAVAFAADRVADRFTPKVSRPPGALLELEFLLECTRCGECAKACPVGAILELDHRAGAASGTPFLDPNRYRACVACEDVPCAAACPTEALQEIPIREAVMGTAVIDRDTCIAWNGSSCTSCYRACPYPEDAILHDEEGRVYIDPRHCIGCGRCRAPCPTRPKSVEIEPPPRF